MASVELTGWHRVKQLYQLLRLTTNTAPMVCPEDTSDHWTLHATQVTQEWLEHYAGQCGRRQSCRICDLFQNWTPDAILYQEAQRAAADKQEPPF